MARVNNCNLPEDLFYWPEKHVWARRESDGSLTVGITDVAQHLAKSIISAIPKEVGKAVKQGKSAGTVESGKWVGPVTAPVSGEILAVNPALKSQPGLLNTDPYGQGWFIKLKPSDWDSESSTLVGGAEGIAAYTAFLESQGINCGA